MPGSQVPMAVRLEVDGSASMPATFTLTRSSAPLFSPLPLEGLKGAVSDAWMVLRWILGIVAAWAGLYLLFRWAPDRPLGGRGPRMVGVFVSLVLWVLFTVALALWFSFSSSAQTYGPLVSVIALLLWAGATAFALHLGLAVTAELAGQPGGTAAASGRATERDGTVRIPDAASDRT